MPRHASSQGIQDTDDDIGNCSGCSNFIDCNDNCSKEEEDTRFDENMHYVDDYYDVDNDHAVVDKNDYFET
jgi:hypothetical protein